MQSGDDPASAELQAIIAALRHLKEEVLFAFGAEGDECIQRLVSARGTPDAIFGAFHQGLEAQQKAVDLPPWQGPDALRRAYETGALSLRLNEQRRRDSGMNIGPLDMPRTQQLLAWAAAALRD